MKVTASPPGGGISATDGTAQAYAEIRDEEGNILAHVEDGQSTDLTPKWETGTTHLLVYGPHPPPAGSQSGALLSVYMWQSL